jgi:excisionase family DNA binding protein
LSKIYKVSQAAELLGVSVSTMQRWDREGRIKAYRNAANRRYYTQEQLNKYLGISEKDRKNIAYARVSSVGQKHDLVDQMDFLIQYCNAKGIIIDEHITDIGSGLNYKRPKWNKLLQEVEDRKVGKIYVTYKDRFVRFGFDWFADFCKRHGAEIIVVNNPKTSPDKELVDDLTSIIHMFSSRLYGLRRYKKKIETDPSLKGGDKND